MNDVLVEEISLAVMRMVNTFAFKVLMPIDGLHLFKKMVTRWRSKEVAQTAQPSVSGAGAGSGSIGVGKYFDSNGVVGQVQTSGIDSERKQRRAICQLAEQNGIPTA